jgi:hypothetical protein
VKPARAPATPDRVLAVTKAQWAAFWSLAEKHAARLQEGARKRHRGPDPRTLLGMRPFEVGAASAGGQRGGGAAVDERKRRLRVASRLSSRAPHLRRVTADGQPALQRIHAALGSGRVATGAMCSSAFVVAATVGEHWLDDELCEQADDDRERGRVNSYWEAEERAPGSSTAGIAPQPTSSGTPGSKTLEGSDRSRVSTLQRHSRENGSVGHRDAVAQVDGEPGRVPGACSGAPPWRAGGAVTLRLPGARAVPDFRCSRRLQTPCGYAIVRLARRRSTSRHAK